MIPVFDKFRDRRFVSIRMWNNDLARMFLKSIQVLVSQSENDVIFKTPFSPVVSEVERCQ